MKTCVVYTRISRTKDDLGVRRQEKLCRELAKRLGWTVSTVYSDNNLSAFKRGKRPQFDAMCGAIERGETKRILAYAPDRLTRDDLRGLEDLIDLLNAHNVAVETHNAGEFDLKTAHGRAQARMAGVWARLESEKASERLSDKHQELREAGKRNGGPRPFGYRRVGAKGVDGVDTREMIEDPVEGPIVREIMTRIANGETLTGVAQDLNERGVRTTKGGEWINSNLRRLVLRPVYVARLVHTFKDADDVERTVTYDGSWPPIVDEGVWRRAGAVLTAPERARRRPARRYLLSGFLVCGRDASHADVLKSRPTYRDGVPEPRYFCPTCFLSIKADVVEQIAADAVIDAIESPAYAKAIARQRGTGGRDLAAEAKRIDHEMQVLLDGYNDKVLSASEWIASKRSLLADLAEVEAQMAVGTTGGPTRKYAGRAGTLKKDWQGMTLDRKRAILAAAETRVYVAGAKAQGNQFNPERVDVRTIVTSARRAA